MRSIVAIFSVGIVVGVFGGCGHASSSAAPADASTSLTYQAQGCDYAVTPPDSRGFLDLALDDGSASPAPLRVRLGLGGSTTSGAKGYPDASRTIAITWETQAPSHAARVRLGLAPAALTDVHLGYSWSTPPPAIGFGNAEPPASFHEVHVCGLTPGTTYYYQVGGGPAGSEVWSATQSFTTVPAQGKIAIGVSGDSRDSAEIFQLVQERMRDAGVSLQVFSGDFVLFGAQESLYAKWLDGAWKDPRDPSKFLTLGQQLMLTVAGNHENESAQYFANFAMPGDGPYAETFGSVDVGSAHLVFLDDEAVATGPTSEASKAHLDWLDQDLARADANRAAHPFLIVDHHRGDFSTAEHASEIDVITARNALVPIWDKHHVDLVLNGHDHNYERSKPVTGPTSAPQVQSATTAGTTYVVCAGSGANPEPPGADPASYREKSVAFGPGTPYVGVYGILTLDGPNLSFEARGLKSAGGSVAGDDLIDSFALHR